MQTLGFSVLLNGSAYIAGTSDGIVTVQGKPSARDIYLLNAKTMAVERKITSMQSGNYIFMGLAPNKEYVVMARDYKREFEPFAWDYVKPADDLTVAEQKALWQSWQTK